MIVNNVGTNPFVRDCQHMTDPPLPFVSNDSIWLIPKPPDFSVCKHLARNPFVNNLIYLAITSLTYIFESKLNLTWLFIHSGSDMGLLFDRGGVSDNSPKIKHSNLGHNTPQT